MEMTETFLVNGGKHEMHEQQEQVKNVYKSPSDEIIVKINSMKLVRLVRTQEVLYNSSAEGYNDKNHKEIIWERIYRALFPSYDTYKPAHQDCIRLNVRRRWKTLRDSISREVKRNATVENYCRKKESPLISELEFLIPHIKSAHCARLADELGLRECYASVTATEFTSHDEDSFNDLIDLTEECDIKPFIKQDAFQYDEMDTVDEQILPEVLSPLVSIDERSAPTNATNATPDDNVDESISATWSKEYCTVAQYKGGEFINPIEENTESRECTEREENKTPPFNVNNNNGEQSRKRARSETEESSKELQAKILQLLSSLEHRERTDHEAQDEDRMFLLSLVSDLKRVPAAKKMMVKMEIVTAIARANNQCQ